MECFAHNSVPSVAVCKVCGKAVCRVCVIESPMAMSCSEDCKKEALDLHEMNQRGKKIYGIGVDKKIPSGVIMWILFSLLFGGVGIYRSYTEGPLEWFLILFACISAFVGFLTYRRSKDIGLQC